LGHIAQAAVLPAFAHAGENSELAALVSGDPVKLRALGRRYGVKALCSYDRFDALLMSGDVDAVYLCVPNSEHRAFAERAAGAGVHVLCEKPLASSEEDCRAIIAAAQRGGARLMTAYRLHFEDANMEAVEIARSGRIGEVRLFSSVFSMQVRPGDVRLERSLGGGAVWDLGVYCVNAARYLFQAEPTEVSAFSTGGADSDARFKEVDEMTAAVLRFPGGRLATFSASFGGSDVSSYRIVGTRGDLLCEPAFEYAGELRHVLTIGGKSRERTFPARDQFAPELVYFSDCVLNRLEPEPSGFEGLADARVVEAIYRSAREGRPIELEPFERARRPGAALEIRRPPIKEPPLVRVAAPHLEGEPPRATSQPYRD
jgi:glucose-fructose oxidoreductase